MSVSGQSGLARFIKLPPVESKKIPDIVKYEARQQIPFPLEDVVWDYQQMAGGSEEEGFVLETEVGLFAMKRDQVFRALKPFEDADIEVDIIQLTPLTIYNFAVFDQMQDLPPSDEYDPDNPPESLVVLSLGTDTTDLVVTNGYRVWQRSVPIGGSHFTKALTKELRLTFAKAEHLKRNAMQAEDQKAVFQAMRPVFNDLLTEIQRSIGFFTSIDRSAKIGRVIALGNAMKLPGLQKYLSQNLGYPIVEVESYRGLSGSSVIGSPAFKENLLSFAVCYGLCLQGLGKGKLGTNLLPREIVHASLDPRQEALGRGHGGGGAAGLRDQLHRLLARLGLGQGRSVYQRVQSVRSARHRGQGLHLGVRSGQEPIQRRGPGRPEHRGQRRRPAVVAGIDEGDRFAIAPRPAQIAPQRYRRSARRSHRRIGVPVLRRHRHVVQGRGDND